MVIFSDGEDTKVSGPRLGGMNVEEILSSATQAKIPVYFIRVSYNKAIGRAFTDPIWKPVVEKTGGKFYAASDEATILSAIQEIDKVSVGKISIRQYSTQQPRFTMLRAHRRSACWMLALALKLTVPYLQEVSVIPDVRLKPDATAVEAGTSAPECSAEISVGPA